MMRTSFQQSSSILATMRSLVIILPLLVIMLGTLAEGGKLCTHHRTDVRKVKFTRELAKFNIKCPDDRILKTFNLHRVYRPRYPGRYHFRYSFRCCKGPIVAKTHVETPATPLTPPDTKSLTPLTHQNLECDTEQLFMLNQFQSKYDGVAEEIQYKLTCKELDRQPVCQIRETKRIINEVKYLADLKPNCLNKPWNKKRYMQQVQLLEDAENPDLVYYNYTCCGYE